MLCNSETLNAYIQKTIDATSISERSIRRIRKEKSDTGMLLSPPKTRNREPRKPVDDFDRCAIRNKIHEFYTVRRQLPTDMLPKQNRYQK
jgi:hypothetical protein